MTEKRFDKLLYGLVPGLLLPVIAFTVFWLLSSELGISSFLARLHMLGILPKILSLCAIPNLLLFFLYIWTNRNFSARGVIYATMIVAFAMLVLKFD